MSDFAPAAEIASTRDALLRLKANMRQTIKGKDDVIEQSLVCLLAGGHLLIEDLPGVGKTTLAYSLARSMDCAFSRIQFTSDLLPTDVTGVSIYDETQMGARCRIHSGTVIGSDGFSFVPDENGRQYKLVHVGNAISQ